MPVDPDQFDKDNPIALGGSTSTPSPYSPPQNSVKHKWMGPESYALVVIAIVFTHISLFEDVSDRMIGAQIVEKHSGRKPLHIVEAGEIDIHSAPFLELERRLRVYTHIEL